MSTATNPMSIQDATAHMLAPTAPSGNDGLPTNSMPILQPVFIPRQAGNLLQQTNAPTSPGSLAASASADWAFLLRNAAAMNTSGANGTPALDMAQLTASANNNLHELVSGRRSPPQIQSSPNVFYSPMASTGPSAIFNSSSMVDFTGGMGQDAFAAAAAAADANGLAAMHLSNNSNLSSSISAAAAMYGDGGVQTLYGSNNQLALAAAGAAAARQTQTLLQQQQAAVNSLNSGIGTLSLGGGMTNGLGKIEESLSGSLFSAAAAAAAAAAAGQAAAQKPVSSSLYIKNLPPDADKLFLYEKFSPYGAILSVKVLNDPHSGQCRGVGFVNFAEHQSALRSIQALHGSKVGDKLMHVSLQTPRIRASAVQMP